MNNDGGSHEKLIHHEMSVDSGPGKQSATAPGPHSYDRADDDWRVAPHKRAIEIGSAAEYICCADLILLGHRAFPSQQGLPYDVVLDMTGTLLRVTVKSTLQPRPRSNRLGSRRCYQFGVQRAIRTNKGPIVKLYTPEEADLLAFVALDIRQVAYAAITKTTPRLWHFDAPGEVSGTNKYGPKHAMGRKVFENFTLARALAAR